MAIKKTELYSSLWASCDELRGGMDASQYKDYVLTLLFMKYVSDKYAKDPYGLIEVPAVLLQRVTRLIISSFSVSCLKGWVCSKFFTEHCDSVKMVAAIAHISPEGNRIFNLYGRQRPIWHGCRIRCATTTPKQDPENQARHDARLTHG